MIHVFCLLTTASVDKSAVVEIQDMLNDLNEVGKRKGLRMNTRKTKYMLLNDAARIIELEGETIEQVDYFK